MSAAKIRANVGGIPFIDPTFQHQRLLAAVASTRVYRSNALDITPPFYDPKIGPQQTLTPSYARALYKCDANELGLNWAPLSPSEMKKIEQAKNTIVITRPAWWALMSLPINFLKLMGSNQGISASIDALPQHVFLSEDAFRSEKELCEQVLHETCHNWLYLISEVWKLHWTRSKVIVTLPSGTPSRTPSELLGALHVVSVLLDYYGIFRLNNDLSERNLLGYRDGCRELISAVEGCFTEAGIEVACSLMR
jgi:hypothetical protein